MAPSFPLEIYQRLEEKLGRDEAREITQALEIYIKETIKEGRAEFKAELKEELKQELATKYDIELVRKDIELLRVEFKKDLRFWLIILILLLIFLNQNALEFIAKFFGLIK